MTDLDELAGKGNYAFNIVFEAKIRTLVRMVRKYQPDCTLEQAKETISRLVEDEWKR